MTIDEAVDAVRSEYNSLASSLATLEQSTIMLAEMGNEHLRDVNAWKLKEIQLEGIRVTRMAMMETSQQASAMMTDSGSNRAIVFFAVLCAWCAGLLAGKLQYNEQWGTWVDSVWFAVFLSVMNAIGALGNAWMLLKKTEMTHANKV